MPRPPRIQDAGLLRHVVSRGTGKMKIFLDDGDRRMFMFMLAEVVAEYDLECLDFCLMNNHFHLSIRNRRRNLSEAMQTLKGEYAACWNVKHRRVGHVFEGPFKDQIVQQDTYLRNLTRYIARNPVRAGLVRAPGDWQWSSCRFHAGLAPPPAFLATDHVLRCFGPVTRPSTRAAYIAHVSAPAVRDDETELFRSRRRVLGDAVFKAALKLRTETEQSADVSVPAATSALHASPPD